MLRSLKVLALAAVALAESELPDVQDAALAADDECGAGDAEGCALNALQLRGTKLTSDESLDLRARGPPKTAMEYKGMAWPEIKVSGAGPKHFFVIGDWGGMDGGLQPIEGRPRLRMYKGGETPGTHVFPRNRWDKPHQTVLCSGPDLIQCFSSKGQSCPPGCGFVHGVDDEAQLLVANAFKARAAKNGPEVILNVGDNFYWGGIEKTCGTPMGTISPTARHQFNTIFEGIYSGAGLNGKPWLSVLGNHDWGGRSFSNGWDQQIAYTWASNRWVMPAPYYSTTVNFVDQGFTADIFMLDSNVEDAEDPTQDPEHNICGYAHNKPGATCASQGGPPSVTECQGWFQKLWAEQKEWLEKKLDESTADWQIVVTHFPCGHESAWYQKLHSSLGLDLLVTGHRHDQELTRVGKMTCLVSGGGGGITSEAAVNDMSQWYGEAQYGFYDLTITKDEILIESINYDGKIMKTATVKPVAKGLAAAEAAAVAAAKAAAAAAKAAAIANGTLPNLTSGGRNGGRHQKR